MLSNSSSATNVPLIDFNSNAMNSIFSSGGTIGTSSYYSIFFSGLSNGYGYFTRDTTNTHNYYQDNTWHHYVIMLNRGNSHIVYIDGIEISSDGGMNTLVGTINYPINTCRFGYSADKSSLISGGIGDLRIYGRVLNAVEIYNLYKYGTIKATTLYALPSISTYTYISSNIFTYTGSNQSITIPTGANHMVVSCWGAGGGSRTCIYGKYQAMDNYGGGGGYTTAVFGVSTQYTYNVIVGGAGQFGTAFGATVPATFGGGGGYTNTGTEYTGCSAGGRSALQYNGADIITAGGGGGSGIGANCALTGGGGGGSIGGNGIALSSFYSTYVLGGYPINSAYIGSGGTQSAGGSGYSAGSKYTGGTSSNSSTGSPGGGGYYGGGAGNVGPSSNRITVNYPGGGGSSFINNSYALTLSSYTNTMSQSVNGIVANNDGLPDNYINNIGNGGFESFFDGTDYYYYTDFSRPGCVRNGNPAQNGLVMISFFT